jgi:hypothetical protein
MKTPARELTPHDPDPPAIDIGGLFDAEVKRMEKAQKTKAKLFLPAKEASPVRQG